MAVCHDQLAKILKKLAISSRMLVQADSSTLWIPTCPTGPWQIVLDIPVAFCVSLHKGVPCQRQLDGPTPEV